MTQQTHNVLWHFTEKLTRDPDDRDELVLMAWKESQKLGTRANVPLMINIMKLRAREMKTRCALGSAISGKSTRDAWNHERVSLNKPVGGVERFTLEETLGTYYWNPLSVCIMNEFADALPKAERAVMDCIIAGYSEAETTRRLGISKYDYRAVKQKVKEKALKYLK